MVSISELSLILEIICHSVLRQTRYHVSDKNNNVSFEGLDMHYH